MPPSASEHLLVTVVSLVLLVIHMCRLDELATSRPAKKVSGRPRRRVFAHVHEHEDGQVSLVDPDGKITVQRRRRR